MHRKASGRVKKIVADGGRRGKSENNGKEERQRHSDEKVRSKWGRKGEETKIDRKP